MLPCIPGNENKTKMVNVVIECPFREVLQKLSRRQRLSGSVKINPPPEQKSTLAVSGINHRLKRAPQVGEGSLNSLPLLKDLVLRSTANWRPRHFLESWEVDAGNRDGGIHLPSEYLTKVLKDKA